MNYDVIVKIDLIKPVGALGWGYPLILSKGSAVAYTECTTLQEVAEAGFAGAEGDTPATATYAAAEAMFSQKHPPAKIAVCGLEAITAEALEAVRGKGWRQLVTVGLEAEDKTTVKTFIGTTNNTWFVGVASVGEIATVAGTSEKIYPIVHSTKSELAAAAVAGEVAGNEVGSITYKNLIIVGVEAEDLTAAEIKAIHEAHGNTILYKAGDVVTSEGLVASGEYADIVDAKNYVVENIEYKTQKLLNNMGKIKYDNSGIAILESVAVDVLKDAYNKGMIATGEEDTPLYSVAYALREDCKAEDIAARKYVGGKFAFTLSGAVHNVEVNGEISIA